MINVSNIQGEIGVILRKILSFFPKNIWLIVLQGKARGYLWFRNSGVDGYWLGSYEYRKQKLFSRCIKDNDIVYDIGAQAGFYTLVAARSAKNVKIYSFEPEPHNYQNLLKHIKVNKIKNVFPLNVAISKENRIGKLQLGENNSVHKLGGVGIKVKIITLDSLLNNDEFLMPNVIKIDIEGEEYNCLTGGMRLVKKYKPKLFIEISNPKTFNLLKELNYKIKKIIEGEYYCYYDERKRTS